MYVSNYIGRHEIGRITSQVEVVDAEAGALANLETTVHISGAIIITTKLQATT